MIHSIVFVQFTCLTVLSDNLCPGPLGLEPSTSYSMHFFTQSSSSFRSTCHTNAACSAAIPMLCHLYLVSLSAPYLEICLFNATHPPDHSALCSLKCHHIFFPYRPGLTSMQHAASHTTAVQPSSHNQRNVLIDKQLYQLPELIPTNSNSGRLEIRYDTIRDAILTYARKPTWVGLIYRTELTTKKCKNRKKTKSRKQICSEITVNSLGNPCIVNPEEEKERAAVWRIYRKESF